MASKALYSVVAVVGIVAASGAAYWLQNKPKGPQEITVTSGGGVGTATSPVAGSPAGGAAAGAAAGASAAGRPGQGGPGGPSGPAGVEVAKVEVTRLQDDAQTVGTLRSRQNVVLRPEVAGRVQSMGFTDGGRLKKGDIFVQLDDVLQRAEVRQAEAQVSIARANLKRNQELVAQSFIAQRVVDEAAANMQVVEAQMALACARWERMRVLAPFDGTAGIRSINLGDYVKDGADMVNIEDLSSMYVDFRLPERFQGKLKRDQPVELQLDAMPGRTFKAKIEAIDPQIDANGRSVAVRAVMANSGGEPLVQRPAAGAAGAAGAASSAGAPNPAQAASAAAGPSQRPVAKAGAKPDAKPMAPGGGSAGAGAGGGVKPVDSTGAACAANNAAARQGIPAMAGARTAGAGAAGTAGDKPSSAGLARAGGKPAGPAGSAGKGGGAGASAGGGGPLRPGMFARVTAVFNIKENSLTVPEEAIVPQGGRQFVIKVVTQTQEQFDALAQAVKAAAAASAAASTAAGGTASSASSPVTGPAAGAPAGPAVAAPVFVDGKRLVSQRTEVKIGIRRPGRVEITDGVAEGDTLVVAGQQRLLRDNTAVRIVDLGRPTGPPGGSGPPTGQGPTANPGPSTGSAAAPAASAAR